MSFIQMGEEFKNAHESPIAPEGEYDLRCGEPTVDMEKGWVMVPLQFVNEDYQPFVHFINLVNAERDAQRDQEKGHEPGTTSRGKSLFNKRFFHLFSIPYSEDGFDTDDIMGATARAGISQEERRDGKGPQNTLRVPRLPENAESPAKRTRGRGRRAA
jgi:hypothetical protein